MVFESFLPESTFLRQFVAYYYSDGSADPSYRNSYLFYPHVNTTVSLYKNAVCSLSDHEVVVSYDADAKYLKLVTQQFLPRRALQIGKTDKVAIVFKPLGLNRFIPEKYSTLVPNEAQLFSPLDGQEWDEMLDHLFDPKEISRRTEILDNFLLQRFNSFENGALEKAITMLSDFENDLSIDEIARAVRISRKTLLRYFKAELRLTPRLFRMILRFRFTLNKKIFEDSSDTLTQIAYEANFFDQPYFIKRFKLLTGVTPGQFFQSGMKLGNEDTFWTFELPGS